MTNEAKGRAPMTAATRRLPLAEYPARRIALIKPSALGDIVHSLPVLTALRRRYPAAHITWVVSRSYEALLRGHPDLDATLSFERVSFRRSPLRSPLAQVRLARQLRAGKFDLVVDLQGLLRSGLMALVSGAARRVGLAGSREGATHCYTDIVPVPNGARVNEGTLHAVERYWLVARALGAGDGPVAFRLPLDEAASRWAAEVLRDCPRPWLVLGVGSRWPTKRWPGEHFGVLARRAQERFGGTALFVGTQDEAALARQVAGLVPGPVRHLAGATTLAQLAALLSRADVILANDTGPLHLAAALGRPVVAPYTCTRPRLHGPYGALAGAVATRVWCAGSYRKRCDRLECMAELTPERLWPVLEEVLVAWQSRQPG
jgi:lipopolysaccharide heptosyltransferase I